MTGTITRRLSGYLLPAMFLVLLIVLVENVSSQNGSEQEARVYMEQLDTQYSLECNKEMAARWDYITDVKDPDKQAAANAASVRYMAFKGDAAKNCSTFLYDTFEDDLLYRQYRFLSNQGLGALTEDDLTRYKDLQASMETTYNTATICDYNDSTKCDLELEPDLERILASSTDFNELQHVWEQWRTSTGDLMRQDFGEFVLLSNEAAQLDGYADTGEYWLNPYTVTEREASYSGAPQIDQQEFRQISENIWNNVSVSLYKKLHSYVRYRLADVYPQQIDLTGHIPANILGNMWAQSWVNIADHVMPFPEFPSYDVSDSMVQNGWDIQQMFDTSEDFFTSLGMEAMSPTFWSESVTNQTAWGKTMICHASAEDFCMGDQGDDWRIKMCTGVNMEDLVTVHHEMGHIEYFMQYQNQPHVFRESANPGFHEVLGSLIALSVSTPTHLENVLGLAPTLKGASSSSNSIQRKHPKLLTGLRQASGGVRYTDEEMKELNFLMRIALEKVAFLPFGYLIDSYRWGVFDGSITEANLNAAWWQLREELQGVTPPGGPRGEEHFDAGAKYHVPANVPYIRYFVSYILQFQFQRSLCDAAGHTGLLHTCDLYQQTVAGDKLKEALSVGFSEPWPLVLERLSGSQDMDPSAIIEYFQPLIAFLDEALLEAGQCVGWGGDCIDEPVATDPVIERKDTPLEIIDSDMEIIDSDMEIIDSDMEIVDFDMDSEINGADNVTETTESPGETSPSGCCNPDSEEEALEAINNMDEALRPFFWTASEASWQYNTDNSDDNMAAASDANAALAAEYIRLWKSTINYYKFENFNSSELVRRFSLQATPGTYALSPEDQIKLSADIDAMHTFALQKLCPYDQKDCDADTEGYSMDDLETELVTERRDEALVYYWEEWRNLAGKPTKYPYFLEYVQLMNKAATMDDNGFKNAGEMWIQPYTVSPDYGSDEFKNEIDELWETIKPLYVNLHAYVRFNLMKSEAFKGTFGNDAPKSPIPAHILGNMWAQSWENIYDLVEPFPDVELVNITDVLADNIGNVTNMYCYAEDFFVKTGMYNQTPKFWSKSMFEEGKDKTANCHASAWDFLSDVRPQTEGDYRIKMCTDKNQEEFIVIHHEMGHTQYDMAYSQKPDSDEVQHSIFRNGANPGIHEAIGDTIALSVTTQSHLNMLSDLILSGYKPCTGGAAPARRNEIMKDNYEIQINQLMKTALAKVALIPYAYILDKFRWGVFAQDYPVDEYNYHWWDLRLKIQGLKPPVLREKDDDFDPGCKYHVANNVPYIRYFVAQILQFQFHERLCELIGEEDPSLNTTISECDIYEHEVAGNALKDLLVKGNSEVWTTQLAEFLDTETGKMDSAAILAYFQPLSEYLQTEIDSQNMEVNWTVDTEKYFVSHIPATVPIVVGVVLVCMICVVVVAFFIGKHRQKQKDAGKAAAAVTDFESPAGLANPGFEMTETTKKRGSISSASSDGSLKKK